MGNGSMTQLDLCIQTTHALLSRRRRIVREMGDQTRTMRTIGGSLTCVTSHGSVLGNSWRWWGARQWLLLGIQLHGIRWSPCFASYGRQAPL